MQWRGSSFLRDHFRTLARGRKLYFIVLFLVGSVCVVLCCLVLVCVIQYMFSLLYRMLVFFRVLIPLLRLLIWIRIYHRKALLAHHYMIMIFSGYTLARKSSMANPVQKEWVPTSLCENISIFLSKETVPDIRDLVVI